jgi:putative transposase
MSKRRTADQIVRLLREADRDLAKGLTVADVCRKLGISQTAYDRWRQQHDPAKVDDARRVRELEAEVERLKLLVAELLLDKKMLQDVAKKTGSRSGSVESSGGSFRAKSSQRARLSGDSVACSCGFSAVIFSGLTRLANAIRWRAAASRKG